MQIEYKLLGNSLQSVGGKVNDILEQDPKDLNGKLNYFDVLTFFRSLSCKFHEVLLNMNKNTDKFVILTPQGLKNVDNPVISEEELKEIKFVFRTEAINVDANINKDYALDGKNIIFIFCKETLLREKVMCLFQKFGKQSEKQKNKNENNSSTLPDQNICQPIKDEVEEIIEIDNNLINESNKKTSELFKDEDFLSLIRVYNNNPDMFNIFASYISNGDAVISDFSKDIDLSEDVINILKEQIKSLDINLDDKDIIDALKKNNGHLNLSLRYLLFFNKNEVQVIE